MTYLECLPVNPILLYHFSLVVGPPKDMLGGLGDIFGMPASQSYITISFQLGGGSTGGDMLGGLGDIFGMPASQSYIPPQEVSCLPCFLTRCLYLQTF